ncbi:MAG: hypothetical protein AAF823_05190 [Planctomycetota bacterium]
MADASQLLRLLEPAVRPVTGGATGGQPAPAAFEGQSFDDLLADAQQTRGTTASTDATPAAPDDSATRSTSLPGLGAIENPSLARMLAERASATPTPTRPDTPN